MASILGFQDIFFIGRANEVFGANPGLLILKPTHNFLPYLTIPEGTYALVSRYGATIPEPGTKSDVRLFYVVGNEIDLM